MVKLKRRYLLVEMMCSESNGDSDPRVKVQDSDIYHAVVAQVASLHGDYGIGAIKSSFQVKIYDENTNIAVFKVSSDGLRFLNSALPFVCCVSVYSCTLRMIFEGSSMRTVECHLIKTNLASLYARLRNSTIPAEKAAMQKAIVSVTGSRMSSFRI